MFIIDYFKSGFKIFRDKSVDNDIKAGQGVEVTSHNVITGKHEVSNPGEEQGWLYSAPGTGKRFGLGSWSQVVPAIQTGSSIVPIKNKALASDSDYSSKTVSSSPGDSSTTAGVAISTETTTYGILTTCLNHASQEQVFFPMPTSAATKYARIRWNYTIVESEDMSEGVIVTYDSLTKKYTPTSEKIWIDTSQSSQVLFNTAGDNTIFRIQLIEASKIRKNVARPLYYATYCVSDLGEEIGYMEQTTMKASTPKNSLPDVVSNYIQGYLLSTKNTDTPWDNPPQNRIKTTIGGKQVENIMIGVLPREWVTGLKAYNKFTEISALETGLPFRWKPIRPVRKDSVTPSTFESAILYSGGAATKGKPIADYMRA